MVLFCISGVMPHIPKFADAVVSPQGYIIFSKHPHHPREGWSHLQITGYVTLLFFGEDFFLFRLKFSQLFFKDCLHSFG